MFNNLFKPIKIGKMETSNRFVVPAMVMNFCNNDGTVTERFIAYHEAKAKGGWGLIITEDFGIAPEGKAFSNIPGLWDDRQIEGYKKLTDRIHNYNTKIFAQIYHAGRQTNHKITGVRPVAPSPIPCPSNQEMPRELTREEIRNLVEKFGDTALRAQKAGFDGVEVHGAHGYLIAQFMSPYSNKRTDEYGGNLWNRMRFPLEIIKNIRAKTGNDFPVTFRISADEFVPGGRTIEDTKAIAIILEEAGIDAIHVTASTYGGIYPSIPPSAVRHGWLTDFAAEVKKCVKVPVIAVGRINDPWLAEEVIASGKADLVAMGRASLADPALPNKIRFGSFDDLICCIGCMQGCSERLRQNMDVKCLVNPTLGREIEFSVKPAEIRKKVFIAGAGPAGAEAAIVAARRGHEVYLYEKANNTGGQLTLASVPPNKGEITNFINWQLNQLNKLGVHLHLNTELTASLVEAGNPDAVIVATGGKPFVPPITGVDGKNIVTAHAVLAGEADTGRNVIVIGGGMVGAETAAHLAIHGKRVAIIEMLPQIAKDVEANVRNFLMKDLEERKVSIYTDSVVKEITEDTVVIERDGKITNVGPFDTVVVAVGAKPFNDLLKTIQGKDTRIIAVGDAVKVGKALEAIEEGYKAGLEV